MPNWVLNKVVVKGKKKLLKSFKQDHFTKDEEGRVDFDFNTIIPMPKEIFRGDLGEEERKKYGANNWYDWSRENWGTKWNAGDTFQYPIKNNSLEFEFNTAWAMPEPIYQKLAALYPDLTFEVEFADEDIGRNCGVVSISNEIYRVELRETSSFALSVWGRNE